MRPKLQVAVVAALLTGCGAGQPTAALPQTAVESRVPFDLARGTGEVEYFSEGQYLLDTYGELSEYDYPKSKSPIGSISFSGGSECSQGDRTFWVVAFDEVAEFKAGGTAPIATLPIATESPPSSCAVDAGGDVAVGLLFGSNGGDVVIFKKGRGSGAIYTTPLGKGYFDGYDAGGDLFIDGFNRSYAFELDELEKGGSKFRQIATSNAVQFPGSVQWDGRYLTVLDQAAGAIYRYAIKGTKATLKGTVTLGGSADCAQTWIARPYVYCADAGNNDGEVFKYPAGGSPVATLTGLTYPLGVVALRAR